MQSPTPLFNSLPVGFTNHQYTNNTNQRDIQNGIRNGNNNTQRQQIMNGFPTENLNQLPSNAAVVSNGNTRNGGNATTHLSMFNNGTPRTTLDSAINSNSLSCDELLDLYHLTKINFLDAEDRLIKEGFQSREIYQELDHVQKQLNYKCDHYYNQLLEAARMNPDVLQKLRDLSEIKKNPPTVKKIVSVVEQTENEESESESESDVELIGFGGIVDEAFKASNFEDSRVDSNSNAEDESQERESNSNTDTNTSTNTNTSTSMNDQNNDTTKLKDTTAWEKPMNSDEQLSKLESSIQSIIEKVNIRRIEKIQAVDMFKQSLPLLKLFKDTQRLYDFAKSSILGISKDVYGTEYDIRYDLAENLVKHLSKDVDFFNLLSKDTKVLKRITNWLRFDVGKGDVDNVKASLSLIESLRLTLTRLEAVKLDEVMSFAVKKNSTYRDFCDKIFDQGAKLEGKSPKAAAKPPPKDAAKSPPNPVPTSSQQTASSKLSTKLSVKPVSNFKSDPKAKKPNVNPAFTRRPTSATGEVQVPPATVPSALPANVQQNLSALNRSSDPTNNSGPVIAANASKNTVQKPNQAHDETVSRPTPPSTKVSFANYLKNGRRKLSGSRASGTTDTGVSSAASNGGQSTTGHKSKGILKVLRDEERRNLKKMTKKTVRFSSILTQVREFESDITQNMGSRKRAKDMESSEAQALKDSSKDEEEDDVSDGRQGVNHGEVTEFILHPWGVLRSMEPVEDCDDASVTRGGTREIEKYVDSKVPDLSGGRVGSVTSSPFEPEFLIVEEEDDDYEIPDVPEDENSKARVAAIEPATEGHEDSMVNTHGFDETPNLDQNVNHDQEVLDLLEDDDMLDSYENTEEDNEIDQGNEENETPEDLIESADQRDEVEMDVEDQSHQEKLNEVSESKQAETSTNDTEVHQPEAPQPEAFEAEDSRPDIETETTQTEDFDKPEAPQYETPGQEAEESEKAGSPAHEKSKEDGTIDNQDLVSEAPHCTISSDNININGDAQLPESNEAESESTAKDAEGIPVEVSNIDEHAVSINNGQEVVNAAVEEGPSEEIIPSTTENVGEQADNDQDLFEPLKNSKSVPSADQSLEVAQKPATEVQKDTDQNDNNEQKNITRGSESPALRESITVSDLMSIGIPAPKPRVLIPDDGPTNNQKDSVKSNGSGLLPSAIFKEDRISKPNNIRRNSGARLQSLESEGQPRVFKIKGAAYRYKSSTSSVTSPDVWVNDSRPTREDSNSPRMEKETPATGSRVSFGPAANEQPKSPRASHTNSSPKSDVWIGNKRSIGNGTNSDMANKLSSSQKYAKVGHDGKASSHYESWSPSDQNTSTHRQDFADQNEAPIQGRKGTEELFPKKASSRVYQNVPNERREYPASNSNKILPTSPRRKDNTARGAGPLSARISSPRSSISATNPRKGSNGDKSNIHNSIETVLEYRSKDVRSFVRHYPRSQLHKYTQLCTFYPNCSFGTSCLYIHQNDAAPAHERYESYRP